MRLNDTTAKASKLARVTHGDEAHSFLSLNHLVNMLGAICMHGPTSPLDYVLKFNLWHCYVTNIEASGTNWMVSHS
jgi:hypothetical protein